MATIRRMAIKSFLVLCWIFAYSKANETLSEQCIECVSKGHAFIKGWHVNAIQNFFCSDNRHRALPGTLIMDNVWVPMGCSELHKEIDGIAYGSLWSDEHENGTALDDITKVLKSLIVGGNLGGDIKLACTSFAMIMLTLAIVLVQSIVYYLGLRCNQCGGRITFTSRGSGRSRATSINSRLQPMEDSV